MIPTSERGVKLGNPPVVEAWVEFHMRGSEHASTWPWGLDPFFGQLAPEFPHLQRQVEESFQVVQRNADGLPVQVLGHGTVRRVRAFSKDQRLCVQVASDVLVVNLVRRDQEYPGFDYLLPEALTQFSHYVEVFRPQSVRALAVHYTDLIRIPRPLGQALRLEEHFRIGVQVPDDDAWVLGGVALEFTVPLRVERERKDELAIGFIREGMDPAAQEDRYRMDWHAQSAGVETLDPEMLRVRLQDLRAELRRRFRACFTDQTWALFKPSEDAQRWR